MHRAATMIQAHFRGYQARLIFAKLRRGVVILPPEPPKETVTFKLNTLSPKRQQLLQRQILMSLRKAPSRPGH